MDAPNIELKVKHDTTKQGKVFSPQAYAAMREQLSKLITIPFVKRLKDVWCKDETHHPKLTVIIINSDNYEYEIEKCCCNDYERELNNALLGVEDEVKRNG